MAQVEINALWRRLVCAILATEQTGTLIQWTDDAETRYLADSNSEWKFEVYHAFKVFLQSPSPMGCQVSMKTPTGETYEFYFQFQNVRFYGKILLRSDKERIVIFSAHHPLKAKLSCEE